MHRRLLDFAALLWPICALLLPAQCQPVDTVHWLLPNLQSSGNFRFDDGKMGSSSGSKEDWILGFYYHCDLAVLCGGGESGAKNPTNPIKILDAAGIRVIARPGKSECSRVFFTAEKDVALEGNKKAVGGFLGGELHSGWNLITVALSGGEGAEGGKLQGTLNGRVAGVVKQEVRAFLSLFFPRANLIKNLCTHHRWHPRSIARLIHLSSKA